MTLETWLYQDIKEDYEITYPVKRKRLEDGIPGLPELF